MPATSLVRAAQAVVLAVEPAVGDRTGDGPGGRLQLVGRAEGIPGAGHEQARDAEPREVLGPQPVRPARGVQRVADQHQPGCGVPSATAIEHMRPPIDRPPRTSAATRGASRAASSTTAWTRTGGRSGALLARLAVGEVHADHVRPAAVAASSMATRAGWLAVGAGARRQEQPERVGSHHGAQEVPQGGGLLGDDVLLAPASMDSDSVRAWVMMRNHCTSSSPRGRAGRLLDAQDGVRGALLVGRVARQPVGGREELLEGVVAALAASSSSSSTRRARRPGRRAASTSASSLGWHHQVVAVPLVADPSLVEQDTELGPLLGQPLRKLVDGLVALRGPGQRHRRGPSCRSLLRKRGASSLSSTAAWVRISSSSASSAPRADSRRRVTRPTAAQVSLVGAGVAVDHEHSRRRLGHVGVGVHVRRVAAASGGLRRPAGAPRRSSPRPHPPGQGPPSSQSSSRRTALDPVRLAASSTRSSTRASSSAATTSSSSSKRCRISSSIEPFDQSAPLPVRPVLEAVADLVVLVAGG